jgi:hypothetical protein
MYSLSHTFFRPTSGKLSAMGVVSEETPSRLGPRHWGQSARETEVKNKEAETRGKEKRISVSINAQPWFSLAFTGWVSRTSRLEKVSLFP